MWLIIQRKKSTRDLLEKIRDEIAEIEEFKQDTQAWHKKLIGGLFAYFSLLYLVSALVAYFKYFNDPAWSDVRSQIQLMAPFIVAPFLFISFKRVLTWWYHRKIKKNEVQLDTLKKQKAKILEEVMETETYKVAKELLDEFSTHYERQSFSQKVRLLNIERTCFDSSTFSLARVRPTPRRIARSRPKCPSQIWEPLQNFSLDQIRSSEGERLQLRLRQFQQQQPLQDKRLEILEPLSSRIAAKTKVKIMFLQCEELRPEQCREVRSRENNLWHCSMDFVGSSSNWTASAETRFTPRAGLHGPGGRIFGRRWT